MTLYCATSSHFPHSRTFHSFKQSRTFQSPHIPHIPFIPTVTYIPKSTHHMTPFCADSCIPYIPAHSTRHVRSKGHTCHTPTFPYKFQPYLAYHTFQAIQFHSYIPIIPCITHFGFVPVHTPKLASSQHLVYSIPYHKPCSWHLNLITLEPLILAL